VSYLPNLEWLHGGVGGHTRGPALEQTGSDVGLGTL